MVYDSGVKPGDVRVELGLPAGADTPPDATLESKIETAEFIVEGVARGRDASDALKRKAVILVAAARSIGLDVNGSGSSTSGTAITSVTALDLEVEFDDSFDAEAQSNRLTIEVEEILALLRGTGPGGFFTSTYTGR